MANRAREQRSDTQSKIDELSGIVFNIQRFSLHDGPGIRTTVFLKSCPLRCAWCSNPESQRPEPELTYTSSRCIRCGTCVPACPAGALEVTGAGLVVDRSRCQACDTCSRACPTGALHVAGCRSSVEEVMAEVARDAAFYEYSGGGMTLSGGEPLCQPDFSVALLLRARALGFHTAIETAGWATTGTARCVLGEADLILYDIKHMDPDKHLAGTGKSNHRILQNARAAASLGVDMVVRVPVIPGFNANLDDTRAIGRFTVELGLTEIHLLPYHRYGVPKYAGLGRDYAKRDAGLLANEQVDSFVDALEPLGLSVRIGG